MQFPATVTDDVSKRLRRVEGQIRGIERMVGEGKECREIVTQLSAARAALDRIGFKLLASALANADGERDLDELEQLFLRLS